MKKVLRGSFALLIGVVAVLGISQFFASESGEVVVLSTFDARGGPHETRVWIVEYEGHAWLRAGADVQGWYQRLLARPVVSVLRGRTETLYAAVPVPEKRDAINALMLEKYGWADRYIAILFGRDDAVPIRLEAR